MANVFSILPGRRNLFCILIISTLLASCAKSTDAPLESLSKLKGDKELKKCNIVKIIEFSGPYLPATFYFEYDARNNPVRVMPVGGNSLYPVYLFRYDKKGRLCDYIIADKELTGFYGWHRYVYDNKNRIVIDTVYIFGTYGDVPLNYRQDLSYVTTYEYDSQDRIITATAFYPTIPGPTAVAEHYAYDEAGNLVTPGAVYDDKVNIHRTNSVWMFLARDYSVNNPLTMSTYNQYQLPTQTNTLQYYYPFARMLTPQYIEYDCKGNQETKY
jgi:hypothetical protein